jgi:hypothetical protein
VSLIQILLVNHESVKMSSALINIVTLYTVMYMQNYKKNPNIAESTSLQNVNLAAFILAFWEGPRKLAPRKYNLPYGKTFKSFLPKGVSDLTILHLSQCLTLFLTPFYRVNVCLL